MSAAQSTDTQPESPVAARYNPVARVMTISVNGTNHAVTVAQAEALAEAICRAADSRVTLHPFEYARAADHIRHARTADLAVA